MTPHRTPKTRARNGFAWLQVVAACLVPLVGCGHLAAHGVSAMDAAAAGSNAKLSKHQYCLEGLESRLDLPPVSIGCSVTDCCAGCPVLDAPWDLGASLVLTVEGALARDVSMRFLNLSPAEVRNLSLTHAAYSGGSAVRLEGPAATIAARPGFGKPLIVAPRLEVSPSSIPRATGASLNLGLQVLDGHGSPVSKLDYELTVVACGDLQPPSPAACRDTIQLIDNDGGDASLVLLDGRTEFGCINDAVVRGTALLQVGNVLPPGDCRNEIMVLSGEDGLTVLDHATNPGWSVWDDSVGNTQPVEMSPGVVEFPLNVVIAMSDGSGSVREQDAKEYMEEAQTILDAHLAGISVQGSAAYTVIPDGDARIPGIEQQSLSAYTGASPTCSELDAMVNALDSLGVFNGSMLNIYFVNGPFTGAHFRYCEDKEYLSTRVIFIGDYAANTTLLHEVGHALYLGHVQNLDDNGDDQHDFGANNIMWPGALNRDQFTAGQVIRCSLEERSLLNSGGYRSGLPKRHCNRHQMSPDCPWRAAGVFTP